MRSLTRRLLVGSTLAVAGVWLAAGLFLYTLVSRGLVDEVDHTLAAQARLLASTIDAEGEVLDLEFGDLDMREFDSAEGGAFLELWQPGGPSLYRSASLALSSGAAPAPHSGRWIDLPSGALGRSVALEFTPRQELEGFDGGPLVLLVARDTRAMAATLADLRQRLWLVGLASLVACGLVLAWLIRRSLTPVTQVSADIAQIGLSDLTARIDASSLPSELVPMVERVNELLDRLAEAFVRERAFSSDVAHELFTPLAGLRTSLEVGGRYPQEPAEYKALVRQGMGLIGQVQSIVERLLNLARVESGSSSGEVRELDLAEAVREGWEPFAARALDRGHGVRFELEPELQVWVDPELLALVLRNLLSNAVEHAEAGASLAVSTRRVADAVELEVRNSGSRLDRAEAQSATQRFWRGDRSRRSGQHCGLGLALVERAASALGGALVVDSEVGGDFVARVRLARPASQSVVA